MYRLQTKVDELMKIVDINKIIKGEKNSLDQIRSYYKTNHWAYRHFHSKDGFMHFRICKHGVFTDEDIYNQPDAIYEYIKEGDVVVELGCGQGANLIYLAHSCPDSRFMGFDLQPLRKMELPENAQIFEQDYSSLPQIADQSVDVVQLQAGQFARRRTDVHVKAGVIPVVPDIAERIVFRVNSHLENFIVRHGGYGKSRRQACED